MAVLPTRSGSICYRLDGADDRPVVILSHSLGFDHAMWDLQAAALAPHFRVLRLDTRGHGASTTAGDETTIEELAGDVLALADALGIDRFAFCGLSLGGMIGQWLGIHAGTRLTHLVLANTTATLSDPSVMEARRRKVLAGGMAAVADEVMARCFSEPVRTRNPPQVASARRTLLATSAGGYAAACAAIRDVDQRAGVARIEVPVLVIAGDLDVSMPWRDHSQPLADAIPGARLVRLEAAHLSNLERPQAFSAALLDFLLPHPVDQLADGMVVRRAALGDAHVDRSLASATNLNRDFQELITRFAWGAIWTRPGLDHRTRRMLVLAITASMGRWEEFRLHLRAGLDRELEWTDVKEVLMQTAVYAGVPAANTGFHIAAEIERERAPNP